MLPPPWRPMALYGNLWGPVGPHYTLWSPAGPCKALCSLLWGGGWGLERRRGWEGMLRVWGGWGFMAGTLITFMFQTTTARNTIGTTNVKNVFKSLRTLLKRPRHLINFVLSPLKGQMVVPRRNDHDRILTGLLAISRFSGKASARFFEPF